MGVAHAACLLIACWYPHTRQPRRTVPKPGETGRRERQTERKTEQLVHPGLCSLPVGGSQWEWGMCALLCQGFMSYTWCAMWKCFLCTVCISLYLFFLLFSSLTPFFPHLSLLCFQDLKVCFSFQWQSIPWLLNVNQWQAAGWHERFQLLVGILWDSLISPGVILRSSRCSWTTVWSDLHWILIWYCLVSFDRVRIR